MRIACIFTMLAVASLGAGSAFARSHGARGGHRAPAAAKGKRPKRGAAPAPVAATAPSFASPAEAYAAGVKAFGDGDDARAIAALGFVLANQPKPEPNTHYYLGRAYG